MLLEGLRVRAGDYHLTRGGSPHPNVVSRRLQ